MDKWQSFNFIFSATFCATMASGFNWLLDLLLIYSFLLLFYAGIIHSLAARAIFFPSLAYNIVMEKVSSRKWYNHIDEHVILGALPLRSMASEVYNYSFSFQFQQLQWIVDFLLQLVNELRVKGIVSLNEDYELRYLANNPSVGILSAFIWSYCSLYWVFRSGKN